MAEEQAKRVDTRELTQRSDAASLSAGVLGADGLRWQVSRRISTLKEIAEDPQVGLGLELIKAPLHGAEWSVESEDARVAEFVDGELRGQWRNVLRTVLTAVEFGFAPHEKLWTLDGVGAHVTLKDLDPEKVTLLRDGGEFAGFRWHGGGSPVTVPPEKAFVFTHWKRWGDLYGVPRTQRIAEYWQWCRNVYKLMNLYLNRRAVPGVMGRAPAERRINAAGTEVDTLEEHHKNLQTLKSGGVATFPAELDEKGHPLWTAELLADEQRSQDFLKAIEHYETMKLRGLIVPERVATQGDAGAWAMADAHIETFLVLEDLLLFGAIEHLNRYLVPQIVAANFGPDRSAVIESPGLSREAKAMLRSLVEKILAQPLTAGMAAEILDVAAVLKGAGAPVVEDAGTRRTAVGRNARRGEPADLRDDRVGLADRARDEAGRWFEGLIAGVKKN